VEDFIGFNSIIEGFNKRAYKGNLSHAHLIIGPDGIGKSLLAKKFAMSILGKSIDKDYVDIINYRPKKASFGVDEVRGVIEEVNKKPYEGDRKVIIIHQGSKLTPQAQNALLKTIEEPPKGVYIIILSESLELMLDTIKSRSQIYKLTPLNREEIIKFIKKIGEEYNEKILVAISYGEGVPGRVIKILRDKELTNLRDMIVELFKDINKSDGEKVLEYENKFNKYKGDKEEVINLIAIFIRDILIYKELEDKNRIINIDKFNDINELTSLLSYKKLNTMLEYINEARTNLFNNVSYYITISMLLIGFLED
jgi:DNA polymerase-3 subunit delta'